MIQDHLLGEIVTEDSTEKCLLKSRKVESKTEQRKLLGIKTSMTYDAIHTRARNKSRNRSSHSKSCKYCGKVHGKGNCPAYGKKCRKCRRENHFKSVCSTEKHDTSRHRPKKGKGKKFHKINEKKMKLWMIWQTKSNLYSTMMLGSIQ